MSDYPEIECLGEWFEPMDEEEEEALLAEIDDRRERVAITEKF